MVERLQPSLGDLIYEAEHHPTRRWDFSWLGERMTTAALPWDFTALVSERARVSESMLDMGTGGGEWLAALPVRPSHTVATEAWAPNVPVASARLAPFGIRVVQVQGAPDNAMQNANDVGGNLPFDDRAFELVTNRHESFKASEVARVLRTGGVFLTQQLGDGVFQEFNELLEAELPTQPPWRLGMAIDQIEGAGLVVTQSEEGRELVTFADVGALAWYMRMVPWTVPDFSIARYRERLEELHAQIQRDGPITLPLPEFFVEARK